MSTCNLHTRSDCQLDCDEHHSCSVYYLPLYYILIDTGRHDGNGHHIASCRQDVRNLGVLAANKKPHEQRYSADEQSGSSRAASRHIFCTA